MVADDSIGLVLLIGPDFGSTSMIDGTDLIAMAGSDIVNDDGLEYFGLSRRSRTQG